jgi:hypothetical protein
MVVSIVPVALAVMVALTVPRLSVIVTGSLASKPEPVTAIAGAAGPVRT